MEIVVISEERELNEIFVPEIENIIYEEKVKKLSLYGNTKKITDVQTLPTDESYLFMVDIRERRKEKDYLYYIYNIFPGANYIAIINDKTDLIPLLNTTGYLQGGINLEKENWKEQLRMIIQIMERKMEQFCKGILVKQDAVNKVIPYEEIFFIETIKGTHCCTIYHKKGKNRIRVNIKSLIQILDLRFEIVHSSTIANLAFIERIDKEERQLHFANGKSCIYSESCYKKFKKKLEKFYGK